MPRVCCRAAAGMKPTRFPSICGSLRCSSFSVRSFVTYKSCARSRARQTFLRAAVDKLLTSQVGHLLTSTRQQLLSIDSDKQHAGGTEHRRGAAVFGQDTARTGVQEVPTCWTQRASRSIQLSSHMAVAYSRHLGDAANEVHDLERICVGMRQEPGAIRAEQGAHEGEPGRAMAACVTCDPLRIRHITSFLSRNVFSFESQRPKVSHSQFRPGARCSAAFTSDAASQQHHDPLRMRLQVEHVSVLRVIVRQP